jgi:hypothetical protein
VFFINPSSKTLPHLTDEPNKKKRKNFGGSMEELIFTAQTKKEPTVETAGD